MGRGGRSTPRPGRITALRFQQRNRERVSLFIDDEFAMGLPAIEAAHLRVGQTLSAAEIERLVQVAAQQRLLERALDFLSYRPRSIDEVQRRLREDGIDDQELAVIIGRLQALGYLDDRAFARWWAENRAEFSPRGPYAIRHELRVKGVADEIIDEVVEHVAQQEDEQVMNVARGRARRLAREEEAGFRRKLAAFLLRRGFSYDAVMSAVEQAWREIVASQGSEEAGPLEEDMA